VPRSRTGRWALGLAGAAITFVALTIVGFATGLLETASSYSDNWLLTGWALTVLASGAAAAAVGAVAIVGRHDLSWTVVLATFLGLCVMALMLNEAAQGI
jgi:hypothetical protein